MGTATSRDDSSTSQKYRRKLPSLKSHRRHSSSTKNTTKTPSISAAATTAIKTIISSNEDSTSSPTSTASEDPSFPIKINPVNLVKHQVVLSDHVSPMSSLSAVISIPMRRSSWRRSVNTTTTKTTNDNTSFTSSFFDMDDADGEVVESPRTSVGSEEHNNNNISKTLPVVVVDEVTNDKKKNNSSKKKTSSFSSLKNGFRRGSERDSQDIVFESKYSVSPILSTKSNEEIASTLSGPPRPFWILNNNDEREYDR